MVSEAEPRPSPTEVARGRRGRLLLVLGALSSFGPLSMDLYLPSLPQLADGLGTTDALAQLTISTSMVGLAVGQLVAGPLSDRTGRLRPLLTGVGLFALTSLACALAPDIGVLIALRLLQGLAGAAGIVIARAMVRDLYTGAEAARVFSLLIVVVGAAPVLAPILGGQLLRVTDWRGLFVALALIGAALVVAAARTLPETLPEAARQRGGGREVGRQFLTVWSDRLFVGYAAVIACSGGTLFTYIGLGSFVLQESYGVSAQAFSGIFAANATGLVLAGRLSATLVGRVGPGRLLVAGLAVSAAAAVVLAASVPLGWGLAGLLPPLLLIVACVGVIRPNATALAMHKHGDRAGMASALLGVVSFLSGAVIAPLASLRGASPVSMTVTIALSAVGALLLHTLVVRPRARA